MVGERVGMIEVWVELSGENLALARAELGGALEALGGDRAGTGPVPSNVPGELVRLPAPALARSLATRLALAHRCSIPIRVGSADAASAWLRREARSGKTAAFRPLGHPGASAVDRTLEILVGGWKDGGGTIALRSPERRFWYGTAGAQGFWFAEEAAEVGRKAFTARRMPTLPFRRPVSLPPRLARVAANLARIRTGDRIVDPFVGTGALLAEAHLLGARVSGADRDAEMIRGAAANLEHLGVTAELLRTADAADPFPAPDGGLWDGVLTDPPYGRSSGTSGELPAELLRRALPAWAPFVRTGGFLSIIVPEGTPRDLGTGWSFVQGIGDRLHRSLTREFRAYRRNGSVPDSGTPEPGSSPRDADPRLNR
jgi:tRNA (guanine10-N2)-dimethyltransferase